MKNEEQKVGKPYTWEDLRCCWDYFIDGHYGLDGNPKTFSNWLAQIDASKIYSNPPVISSVCLHPLYPELNEAGNKEAQELMDKFKKKAKKVLDELLDDYLGTVYCNLLPDIESDSWRNYRNTIMAGMKNYDNRLIQSRHDFKEIRQQIYKQFKADIDKDLNQDNLEKIKELEGTIKMLRKLSEY